MRSEVPALFVAGTLDGITPVAQTREIAAGFSRGQVLVVKNGGHNSQLRPAAVQAAVAAFYRGEKVLEKVEGAPMAFMPLIATEK